GSSTPTRSAAASVTGTVDGSFSATPLPLVSPIRFAFFSRSSHGSTPISSAIRFRCVSTANDTDVTPNPRIAVVGTRFVKQTKPSKRRFGIVYAPEWWNACFVRPYGENRANAPESCSVSIRRPRIQPSFVTASAISMCHGARVEEQRNSSSRVQRHLIGVPDLSASREHRVSVAVSTLPPKPPPTVPPTNLNLFNGCCRCAATPPIEK